MSSQELPQALQDVEMQRDDAAQQQDATQQEEPVSSTETQGHAEAKGSRQPDQKVPPVGTQQQIPSSEPAVPSSDAVLPSSPSPVKQLLEPPRDPNHPEPTSKKRPADDIDSITHTTATEAPIATAGPSNDQPSTSTNEINPPPTEPPNPALTPLQTKLANLQSHLSSLQTLHTTHIHNNATLPSGLPLPETWNPTQKQTAAMETANAVIKEHIALLHSYNEIKDVGMGLMGLVAEKRGCRVKEVMGEFGVGEKD